MQLIDELPYDIIVIVLLFVEDGSVDSLSTVCKKWHKASQSNILWKERVLRLFSDEPQGEHGVKTNLKLDWKRMYYTLNPRNWKFDQLTKADCIIIENNGSLAKMNIASPRTNFSVFMTRAMLPSSSGVYYFEVQLCGNEKYNISIGVADKYFKLTENFAGYPTMKKNTPSWSYSNNGFIRNGTDSNGSAISTAPFTIEDTIGVLVDFKHSHISFFKNGKLVESGANIFMKNMNPALKYWPVVTLYSKVDKVSIPSRYKISFWNDLLPLLLEDRLPLQSIEYDSNDDDGDAEDFVNFRISKKRRNNMMQKQLQASQIDCSPAVASFSSRDSSPSKDAQSLDGQAKKSGCITM